MSSMSLIIISFVCFIAGAISVYLITSTEMPGDDFVCPYCGSYEIEVKNRAINRTVYTCRECRGYWFSLRRPR